MNPVPLSRLLTVVALVASALGVGRVSARSSPAAPLPAVDADAEAVQLDAFTVTAT